MSKPTLLCPNCDVEVTSSAGHTCSECTTKYRKIPFCPECGDSLEALKACGNVSYYCNGCRMQKSRTTIDWRLHPVAN
ncbi:zinc-ribbon domain-containing protein [Vibrio nomapromontoriensis]|uniref:YfgJ family double zinc ribbon protein n=1 Tax=Vibrio nomapromontoriensis TaxID=2910246 RepID=UPI003D0B4C35